VDRIFLDTDMILDFFLDRKPFSDDSAKILTWCELKEIQGFSAVVRVHEPYSEDLLHTSRRRILSQ
jgi:predicted nucleic acid-binding protein